MQKSLEQLKRLANNPFYQFTAEEAEFFRQELEKEGKEAPKKERRGSAVVRRTGSIEKHPSGIVKE